MSLVRVREQAQKSGDLDEITSLLGLSVFVLRLFCLKQCFIMELKASF